MEPESSDASHLPWIWFIECLAKNKEVDYLTLHDVARKVPGLSGNAAMQARELLALRCLEGLAEMCTAASEADASRCGSKVGLDLYQRCSVVLFNLTSEAIKSGSGLDGMDVSNWDIQSFVEHKRAQLPKCTLEVLEEIVLEGKDPAAESLQKICRMDNIDRSEAMDTVEGAAKGVSLVCNETGHRQVGVSGQQIMDSIPENNVETEKGSSQDRSKYVLLQEAMMGRDLRLSELMVGTGDGLEKKSGPAKVGDNPIDVEGYHNENIDPSSLKNNVMSSQDTSFDLTLCMKCNKSGSLLCCSSSVCSVSVHRDCLGVEPCFDDSGRFHCPFCASSSATADYLEAKRRAGFRKRELDVYLSSSLLSKLPQLIQNKKNRMNLKQGDMSHPMIGHNDEEKAGTDWNQPNHNGKNRDHVSPKIGGDADVNAAPESSGAGMGGDMPEREINKEAAEHGFIGVTVEPTILLAEDILPPRGKNTVGDATKFQPQDAFEQPSRNSEEADHQNCYAIVLYEGDKVCDKNDTISQNHPESKSNHVRPVRNIPRIMISKATSNVPYQSYPAYRKRKVPWSVVEEDKLREGVKKFHNPKAGCVIPWSQILEFGALVFQPCRTAENLKDKWRNMCKKDK